MSSGGERSASPGLWDVVVIGAGPAGAIAAHQIALAGAHVLLLDKASFPREKVCGCCLGSAALAALASAGLGDLPDRLGACPLHAMRLAVGGAGGRTAIIALANRRCLSRSRFDAALAACAVEAGASFRDGVSAAWASSDASSVTLRLRGHGAEDLVRASVVLVADGLAGRSLENQPRLGVSVRPGSRLGAAATLDGACDDLPAGVVCMAVGAGGYVGTVRLEDGRIDIAAALDPAFVRAAGGPAHAAAMIRREAGLPPIEPLAEARWRGAPTLTRRRTPAAHRLFVLGDAAGYAEPFTGEGIGWALRSGIAAAPLAAEGARRWRPALAHEWIRTHARLVGRRQLACRTLAKALRSPLLARWAVRALGVMPAAASPILRWIDGSRDTGESWAHAAQEAVA